MADPIIEPAPAYNAETPSPTPSQRRSQIHPTDEENRARRIKSLQKTLRIVNNITEPIHQSILIEQQNLSQQLQIIVRTTQLINLTLILKAILKCSIDDEYLEIDDPSPNLQTAMEAGHQSIDALTKMCVESLSATINYIQRQ